MIDKIKRVIVDYHGEKEWFIICLKTGGWQFYPSARYRFDEWRIDLDNGIKIDIQDQQNGRYRVSVGVPREYGHHRWEDVEFAQTNQRDAEWEYRVGLLLSDAYNDPNIVCGKSVI